MPLTRTSAVAASSWRSTTKGAAITDEPMEKTKSQAMKTQWTIPEEAQRPFAHLYPVTRTTA
eukprot:scaffold309064_cov43-Prasinocladus_malaysianus.AAC.1